LLARIDGMRSLGGVISGSPLGKEETQRRLYAMLLAGVIEKRMRPAPVPDPAPAPPERVRSEAETRFRDAVVARYAAMRFGSFYDRLDIPSTASEKRIQHAYQEALRTLEPDASFAGELSDLKKRIGTVLQKITEAYETLADPMRRRAYDRSLTDSSKDATLAAETLDELTLAARTMLPAEPATKVTDSAMQEAELYFLEANRHWQAGDYFDAVASMNEAVRLHPSKASYHRTLGRWLAENPSCVQTAREHFERAIELDPGDRDSLLELAKLFESEGEREKAQGIYQKLGSAAAMRRH
jgi:tetratricopeptide (TPR) repeat protein